MSPPKRRIRLLVADDDHEVRQWLRLVLRPLRPAEVVEAGDGEHLLSLLLSAGHFDLVVTDIRMPRQSGLEAAELARRAGCGLPFVFITGFGDEATAARVRGLGSAVLLAKPVDGCELLEQIQRLLLVSQDHE